MTLSIITPCFNEQENIKFFFDTIKPQLDKIPDTRWEIIFVDDGSTDNTLLEIMSLKSNSDRIKIVELSRNFGKEAALSAGINNCHSDAAIFVDVDLQYPVEKISEFVEKYKEGYDVVIGLRDKKNSTDIIEKIGSNLFYKIMDLISETKIQKGALDFRLINSNVIDKFNHFTERGRITRGLIDWLGFKRAYINYNEKPRKYGSVKYSFSKRLALAIDSFLSYSYFPMKLVGYLGVLITVTSLPFGIVIFVTKYILKDPFNLNFTGAFSGGLLNTFLTGIILVSLGLISKYIANIQIETKNS